MSYLQLNKRQTTGEIIKEEHFVFEGEKAFIKLIKLEKPYADGTAFAVYEDTKNAFCSNGLFVNEKMALNKYYLMLRNCGLISDDRYKKLEYNKFNY